MRGSANATVEIKRNRFIKTWTKEQQFSYFNNNNSIGNG
jgi:hypothetical protein